MSARYSVVSTTGNSLVIRANQAAHAAYLAGAHWYPGRTVSANGAHGSVITDSSGVFDIIDIIDRTVLNRVTVSPRVARTTPAIRDVVGVVNPCTGFTVTLDDGSASTLRALGEGNLSLGIRRAAALLGGTS